MTKNNNSNDNLEKKMRYLLGVITEELLDKIQSGNYDSKDVQAALKLLKDNNISIGVTVSPDTHLEDFHVDPKELPFEELSF